MTRSYRAFETEAHGLFALVACLGHHRRAPHSWETDPRSNRDLFAGIKLTFFIPFQILAIACELRFDRGLINSLSVFPSTIPLMSRDNTLLGSSRFLRS
jgi:hypothetical protein